MRAAPMGRPERPRTNGGNCAAAQDRFLVEAEAMAMAPHAGSMGLAERLADADGMLAYPGRKVVGKQNARDLRGLTQTAPVPALGLRNQGEVVMAQELGFGVSPPKFFMVSLAEVEARLPLPIAVAGLDMTAVRGAHRRHDGAKSGSIGLYISLCRPAIERRSGFGSPLIERSEIPEIPDADNMIRSEVSMTTAALSRRPASCALSGGLAHPKQAQEC